ncbi:hypothetical protein BRD19_08640 [Halobacteriales archaeon SW_7_65_23]|nr:MAG: hypothetical protein BRD19_08640 [Halobacteriales archaeon SW_7_65_23]
MNRQLAAIAILGVVAVGAVLFPTAAVPFGEDVDEVAELPNVTMSPTDAPNSVYADVDDDTGEIRLNLTEENQRLAGDGVNGDAVTEIDNLFTVTYTGDRGVYVWLTDDEADDNLRFYRDDDPTNSFEGEADGVRLTTGDSIRVGFVVDTTDPDHGVEAIDTFTLHAEYPEETVAVETTAASDVTRSSAVLGGELTELGGSDEVPVFFEYRETGASDWHETVPRALTSADTLSETVTDLEPGTEYEYRAVATMDWTTDRGAIETFTTDAGTSSDPPEPTPTPGDDPPEKPTEETPGATPDDGTAATDAAGTAGQGVATPTDTPDASLQGMEDGSGGGSDGGGPELQLLGGPAGSLLWLLLLLLVLLVVGLAAALRTNLS